MPRRHPGHEAAEQRGQRPGQLFDEAGPFGDLEQAQPQTEQASQANGHIHGQACRLEAGRHYGRKNLRLSAQGGLHQANQKGYEEEAQPYPVQHCRLPREIGAGNCPRKSRE
jgi:hypothetical protein